MTPILNTAPSGLDKFWAAVRAGLPMFLGGAAAILAAVAWPEIIPHIEMAEGLQSAPVAGAAR